MSKEQTYNSSCHCGKMRAKVTVDLSAQPALVCNCSICNRTGMMLRFLSPDKVEVLSSDGASDYQFGKKNIHHLFCSNCGVRPWGRGKGADGQDMFAINLRCLDDFDPQSVQVTHFDGKSR